MRILKAKLISSENLMINFLLLMMKAWFSLQTVQVIIRYGENTKYFKRLVCHKNPLKWENGTRVKENEEKVELFAKKR